jgi:thiosulfate/3-mercaptopyruvate sulfurtransferase
MKWKGDSLLTEAGAIPVGAVIIDARSGSGLSRIPNAVVLDWKSFFDADTHSLKLPAEIQEIFGAAGVGVGPVVVYDDGGLKGPAGMIFWLLEYVGHLNVSLLNGGLKAYQERGLPLSAETGKPSPVKFGVTPRPEVAMNLRELISRFGDYKVTILDPRSDEEYLGWALHGEKRGGHIRTAISFDPDWACDAAGGLKPQEAVYELLYQKTLTPEKEFIIYSNFDTRGTGLYFLLRLAGYGSAACFTETFNVWAENELLPIAQAKNWKSLVSPEWVYQLVRTGKADTFTNKSFAVYECSWGTLEKAGKAYKSGHIPGAFHLDSDTFEDENHYWDLFEFETLAARFAKEGITKDTTVILYGNGSDTISATIAFWALRYAGVSDVRLLNGNFERWIALGYPSEMTINVPKAAESFGRTTPQHPEYAKSTEEVKLLLKDPNARVCSVRSWPEFTGEVSRHSYIKAKGEPAGAYWARAGFGENKSDLSFYFDPDGSYRSYIEVEKMWVDLDITPSNAVVFYCGTGARGSTAWFFSHLMGWASALYDSGWFGWSEGKEVSPNPSQRIWSFD